MEWTGRFINNIEVLRGLKHIEFVESHFPIRCIALDMLDGAVVGSWLQLVYSWMSSA